MAPPAARYYGEHRSGARSAPGGPGGRPPGLALAQDHEIVAVHDLALVFLA